MRPDRFVLTCLLIALPEGFWWGVLASILAGLAFLIMGWLVGGARVIFKMYRRFTLAGIWIGVCKLPNYPPGVEAIEIYRLAVKGDVVRFNFFNYRPDTKDTKYLGEGVCRVQLFSAYYYIPAPDCSESGVFVVRKTGETLKGLYAQYDLRANEVLKVSGSEDFILRRIPIPWWKRVRMFGGLRPYAS